MNIQRFDYFLSLAETLSYTETAERLFTTQGNVSKQIIALEKELDTSLFLRSHRKITLTKAGEQALPYARAIVQTYQELKQKVSGGETSQLTLYGIPSLASYQTLAILGDFYKTHPEVTITVEEKENNVLFDALNNDDCDLILARLFDTTMTKYEQIILAQDNYVVVLPKKHDLATRKTIQLSELKEETFLQLGKHTPLYDTVVTMCQQAGFEPRIGYHGRKIELILNFIANDMGISLMMAQAVKTAVPQNVVVVPLEEVTQSTISFIRKRTAAAPALTLFWEFLKKRQA